MIALLVLAALIAPPSAPGPDPLAALGLHVVQPMSAEAAGRRRAEVDALIAQSAPAGVLENVTDANGGRVRHVASRLTCALGEPGQRVRSSGPDEVVCEGGEGANGYRTRVVRAPAGATLDSVAATAAAEARREPGFALQPGPLAVAKPKPGSGLREHRTLAFHSRVDGREQWSRVMVGLVDGWVLTERTMSSTPPQGFDMATLMSETMFGKSMLGPTPSAPPPASP